MKKAREWWVSLDLKVKQNYIKWYLETDLTNIMITNHQLLEIYKREKELTKTEKI